MTKKNYDSEMCAAVALTLMITVPMFITIWMWSSKADYQTAFNKCDGDLHQLQHLVQQWRVDEAVCNNSLRHCQENLAEIKLQEDNIKKDKSRM